MSKKHYIMLAATLKLRKPAEGKDEIAYFQWAGDVKAIATVLQGDNVLFDREKFYIACGIDE